MGPQCGHGGGETGNDAGAGCDAGEREEFWSCGAFSRGSCSLHGVQELSPSLFSLPQFPQPSPKTPAPKGMARGAIPVAHRLGFLSQRALPNTYKNTPSTKIKWFQNYSPSPELWGARSKPHSKPPSWSSASLSSSAVHPEPGEHPAPPPTATLCPGQPHACWVWGLRAEPPHLLSFGPKGTLVITPCTDIEIHKHMLKGQDPEHPWYDLAPPVWGLPSPAWTQPGQALNQPWCCANKWDSPSSPRQRGFPCSCRNIDPDKPGRHIMCPGGVRRSAAQLATPQPVPMGSGMGKGSTGGPRKPLTLPRKLGPKCFCQGEVKQINEGPP